MSRSLDAVSARQTLAGRPPAPSPVPVGASFSFDPRADGIAGIYASRVLERGLDPRTLCADIRADRFGAPDREPRRRVARSRHRATRFGRGTAQSLTAVPATRDPDVASPATRRSHLPSPRQFASAVPRRPRRLAVAGLLALLLFPLGIVLANAQTMPSQARYIVQPGDTLDSVAAEFGVDPAAILAASALQNPPLLTAQETIVIPGPAESPDAAAANAAQRLGASPFVVGAHEASPGETLGSVAAAHGLDPWALAAFNGIADIDALSAGQRLRIPLTDSVVLPSPADLSAMPIESAVDPAAAVAELNWASESVGGSAEWSAEPASPVFAADVPAYLQAYSLSCEYAAVHIATAAFGWGIPESAFLARVGSSPNPHWGYRGDIHGAWGGADDYGVYPEALVPTLNEFGFVGEVFYGGDASSLTSRIDAGMPVVTWLGYFGHTAWLQEDAGAYLLAPGMHVVTVYGYDDWGVYLSNPGRGNYDYYAWGDFLEMWGVLDGMALAIAPT